MESIYRTGRAIDTRDSGPLNAGATMAVAVGGYCGIPHGAKEIAITIVPIRATEEGVLVVAPAGGAIGVGVNYAAGRIRASNAIVRLGAGDAVSVTAAQATGNVHFVIDVTGYFQ